jgi:hypothetical protein
MKQWSYYINVYYKYTHGSLNINNKIYILKIILYNISFVKIIIVRLNNQIWYPKLNVAYFWNNYNKKMFQGHGEYKNSMFNLWAQVFPPIKPKQRSSLPFIL